MPKARGSMWKHPDFKKPRLGRYNWTRSGERVFELVANSGKVTSFESIQMAEKLGWKKK